MCDKCDYRGLCYTIIIDDKRYHLCSDCWNGLVLVIKDALLPDGFVHMTPAKEKEQEQS